MVTEYFFTFSVFSCGKMEKIIFPARKNIFPSRRIFLIEKYFRLIFGSNENFKICFGD